MNTDMEFSKTGSLNEPETKEVDANSTGDDLTPEEQRKVKRQLDIRVTGVSAIILFISLLDRSNLGFAMIAGMGRDLALTVGNRYNVVALVFFGPYVLFEFPAVLFVRVLGVRRLLAGICIGWGAITLGMGFVTNWRELAGLRVLLGAFEAASFSICVYLLSSWYTRYEVQKRYAIFWLISTLSGAFGGILAYGISQMDGTAGRAGWRWIFILEGMVTVLIGFFAYFAVVEFPDNGKKSFRFLNARETQWVVDRKKKDNGDANPEPFSLPAFLRAGSDFKLWMWGLIFACETTVNYGTSFFAPTIIRQMGYSVAASQILSSVPPFVFASILSLTCGWLGDRYRIRGPLVLANALISFIGVFVVVYTKSIGARYIGIFLLTAGSTANVPSTMAYQSNNINGQWPRAFGSATLVCFGGIGGMAGALVFRSQDAPQYLNGFYACMAAMALIMVIVLILTVYFVHQNRQAKAGKKILLNQEGVYYTL